MVVPPPAAAQRLALGQARLRRLNQLAAAGRRQRVQLGQVERHPYGLPLLRHAGRVALLAQVATDAHHVSACRGLDGTCGAVVTQTADDALR